MNAIEFMLSILERNIPLYLTRGHLVDNVSSDNYLSKLEADQRREARALSRQEKKFNSILESVKKKRPIKLKKIECCIFTTDYEILD